MLIENSDALKKYLMESLARISDADPGALSKYILALLKKPRSEDDLKVFFLDQLEVFLMKDTAKFVEQLFEAIKTKSYLQPSVPKTEKIESSERDNQSSENHKSKRRGKVQSGNDLYNKKNQPLSSSRSRSRSPSPEKSERDRENSSHTTHVKETLNEAPSYLKNRDAVPREKPAEPVHPLMNTLEYQVPVPVRSEKLSIRCKDYDERGYCLLGDSCPFNHGLDPVIVEDVSCLNFAHMLNDNVRTSLNVCERKESPLPPPPPPLPPLPPPPLPPTSPPPLPSSLPMPGIGYIPEPYNPECPAMEQQRVDSENYYSIPLQKPFQVPSHISQTQSSIQTRLQNSKPIRSRELIGVPTVDSKNDSQSSLKKRKAAFDFSRLGPKPKRMTPDSTTIELRRVPQASNSISTLHDHFSRFGKIMNIQVCYDDDPEASLITFSSPTEANAAYRSSEPVLNNRFIKVFIHNPNRKTEKEKEEEKGGATDNNSFFKKDNLSHSFQQKNFATKKGVNEAVVYAKGNLSKTVYLKKINNSKPDALSMSSQGKVLKDEKKNTMSKLELFKKKQEILETLIQQQKLVVERLKTTQTPKQRESLKKIIDDLSSKITALENELKCSFEKEKTITLNPKSIIAEKKKELLDAEMDLYKTLNKGDENDTALLLMKVRELKERAKAFGLLDTSYAKGGLRRKIAKPVVHSFPSKPIANFSKLLKTDNRPKSLLISGVEDKDALVTFLQKFSGVEKINPNAPKGCTVIFSSRKIAETLFHTLNGYKLGNEIMSVSWFQDIQPSPSEDVKEAKEENDSSLFVDGEGEGEEDEDEEEDSEARSWRR